MHEEVYLKLTGAFLDDFLMTTLDGTLSFKEGYGIAQPVTEDLDLDVTTLSNVLFHEDTSILEQRLAS